MPPAPPREHADLRHFFGCRAQERIPAIWAFHIDLALAATAAHADADINSPLACRRRPGRRPCPGYLVTHRSEVDPSIRWQCPECKASGVLVGFRDTEWDLSGAQELDVLAFADYPLIAHAQLRNAAREVPAIRAIVHRAVLVGERIQLPVRRNRLGDFAAWLGTQDSGPRNTKPRRLLGAVADSVRKLVENRPVAIRTTARVDPPPGLRAGSVCTYRLKIILCDTHPPVWRRLLVPADLTLAVLHRVFQAAMGWLDNQLHLFRVAERVWSPDNGFVTIGEDARGVRLLTIAPWKGSHFRYEYGDGWTHRVLVEDVVGLSEPVLRCLGGRRACPPEGCRDPWTYAHLLMVREDPEEEVDEDLHDQIGEEFDPEAFDAAAVHAALASISVRQTVGSKGGGRPAARRRSGRWKTATRARS